MFILFFGGQIFVNYCGAELTELGETLDLPLLGWDYVEISAFAAGVFAIGFIFGAYMTETFRAGSSRSRAARSKPATHSA